MADRREEWPKEQPRNAPKITRLVWSECRPACPVASWPFVLTNGPGILAATILLADTDAGSESQPRRTLSYPEKQIIPLTPLSLDY